MLVNMVALHVLNQMVITWSVVQVPESLSNKECKQESIGVYKLVAYLYANEFGLVYI